MLYAAAKSYAACSSESGQKVGSGVPWLTVVHAGSNGIGMTGSFMTVISVAPVPFGCVDSGSCAGALSGDVTDVAHASAAAVANPLLPPPPHHCVVVVSGSGSVSSSGISHVTVKSTESVPVIVRGDCVMRAVLVYAQVVPLQISPVATLYVMLM